MKTWFSRFIASVLVAVACLTTAACTNKNENNITNVITGPSGPSTGNACATGQAQKITFDPSGDFSGPVNTTRTLTVTVNCGPTNGTWSSTNTAAVTVVNGFVSIVGVSFAQVCYTLAESKVYLCIKVTGTSTGPQVFGVSVPQQVVAFNACNTAWTGKLPYMISVGGGASTAVKFTTTHNALASIDNDGTPMLKVPNVAGTDTVRIASDADSTKFAITYFVVTVCPPNTQTTVSISPKPVNTKVNIAGEFAVTLTVSNGTIPQLAVYTTLNCGVLTSLGASGTSNKFSVISNRPCRDSIVAKANGVEDYTILNVSPSGTSFPSMNLTVCGAGYTGTTYYQTHTVRNGVELLGPSQVQYYTNGKVSVDPVTGRVTPVAVGIDTVRAAPVASPNDVDTYVFSVSNTGCQYSLPQGPYTISSGQSCPNNSVQLTSPVAGTWSLNSSIATVTPSGMVTAISNQSGTVNVTFTPTNGGSPQTVPVNVTSTTCVAPIITTVVVSPNPLALQFGQSNNLTATVTVSSGNAPLPTWFSTLGCVNVPTTASVSISLTGTRACRDSVVAIANGVKGYSIVNVTSGVTGCSYTSASGTYGLQVSQTSNLTSTCTGTGPFNPFWFSKNTAVMAVVGAPTTIVISGFSFPAGMTAQVKAVGVGTTDVCEQVAVQDPTLFFCRTWTVTAVSSSVSSSIMFAEAGPGKYVRFNLSDIPPQPTASILR